MALILVGRRLPVLRYLSELAAQRSDNVFGIHTSSVNYSSNTGGPKSGIPIAEPSNKEVTSDSSAATGSTAAATVPIPTDTDTPPASTSQPATVEEDDEWTEVVHSTGQVYYWNQRTGETTHLGEPKPKSDGSGSGSGSAGTNGGSTGRGGGRAAEAGGHDPRAEAPLEDRTGTYAAMGVLIGALLGWVSQFV